MRQARDFPHSLEFSYLPVNAVMKGADSFDWQPLEEIVAEISQLARANANVSQRSGGSVRLSVSNHELRAANSMRRGLAAGETVVAPRVSDLDALVASTAGKIEIESVEEGREGAVFEQIVRGAVLQVYKRRVPGDKTKELLAAFESGAWAARDGGRRLPADHGREQVGSKP